MLIHKDIVLFVINLPITLKYDQITFGNIFRITSKDGMKREREARMIH